MIARKMKKGLTILIATMIAVIVLCSCGSKKPENMTNKVYGYNTSALKVMNKYNKGNMKANSAIKELEKIYEQAKKYNDSVNTELKKTNVADDKYAELLMNELECSLLLIRINNFCIGINHNEKGGSYSSQYDTQRIAEDLSEYLTKN